MGFHIISTLSYKLDVVFPESAKHHLHINTFYGRPYACHMRDTHIACARYYNVGGETKDKFPPILKV